MIPNLRQYLNRQFSITFIHPISSTDKTIRTLAQASTDLIPTDYFARFLLFFGVETSETISIVA